MPGIIRRSTGSHVTSPRASTGSSACSWRSQLSSHLIWTRDRPFITHPHIVHLLVHHAADASFPSDHSAALAAVAVLLAFFERRLAALFGVWTVLVGIARVYVGEHYPGDILGGWAVGVACGLGVALLVGLVSSRPTIRRYESAP